MPLRSLPLRPVQLRSVRLRRRLSVRWRLRLWDHRRL